jgi:tetratricopeptide (TPR) repeat protein
VLGKLFWAGALAEIGGRGIGEVELDLHELSRKELVRPGRTTSMGGESEYSFWHLLIRDVAYAQIPRAERGRRHRAAAAWIERKAGKRVDELAEVLAHHYLQAFELAKASGDTNQAEEVRLPARRFLALAGDRALGLDAAQAEARLAQALELMPSDDSDGPQLLVSWAEAVFQVGRPREAAEALERALALLRGRGETEAAARALQLRSALALRLGEGRHVALAAEAVELLEQEPAGPALVPAYTQLAHARCIAGAYPEAIAAADRARVLAETYGLPEPARALSYRGYARCFLGDAGGLKEMERALPLLVERGAGRDAAIVQNNLAIARYPLQGPARSLAGFDEAIVFCEQRGLVEFMAHLESNRPVLLAELGRTEEMLAVAARLAPALETSGLTHSLCELRAVELAVRVERGELVPQHELDWLIETARATGAADVIPFALAAAAAVAVGKAPERARSLLAELYEVAGAHETSYYARQLPAMVRTALASDDRELAQRLADGLEPRYPLEEHALCAARAQLAEHADDRIAAVSLYAEASERWQTFGNVPERAYALLGQGRCLLALGRPGGKQPLRDAGDLLASTGYKPAYTEIEALLEQMTPSPRA